MNELILVLDFGGQYKELIARRIRDLNVYSEVKSDNISAREIRELSPRGIILTGGPASVYAEGAHLCDPELFELGIPVLGICYGMQMMCHQLGGEVVPAAVSEYGVIRAQLDSQSKLFAGMNPEGQVLMSHTDYVKKLPPGFRSVAGTADCPNAACECPERQLYCVQFHPETGHTKEGIAFFKNFLFQICGVSGDYKLEDYLDRQIESVRRQVGREKVLLALSGGVDSSVCARLLSRAIPGQLYCIFVDHGFMRLHEGDQIEEVFSNEDIHFIRINAQKRFLNKIKGVTDPERKRKLVGEEFVRVFEEEALKLGDDVKFLAQGTIYPDIIESGGGETATIKSHHNVGGLPKNLNFIGLVEPLSGLFKDEVRRLGVQLGLPDFLVNRQPFPGPGLSIRVMGRVTKRKLDILRLADHILREELDRLGEDRPQQYFAVFPNVRSVGVMGDKRTYDYVIALRAVNTTDFMTADYSQIPHELLSKIASRITNEVPHVSRVVYDITSKPPGTVEWE